jgi:hypothetical protein
MLEAHLKPFTCSILALLGRPISYNLMISPAPCIYAPADLTLGALPLPALYLLPIASGLLWPFSCLALLSQ